MKMPNKVNKTPIMEDEVRNKIRVAVDNFDDLQELRIAMGNRVYAAFKTAVLSDEEIKETDGDDKDKESQKVNKVLKTLLVEYDSVTDAIVATGHRVNTVIAKSSNKYVINKFYYDLIDRYVSVLKQEQEAYKTIADVVKQHPMWELCLKDIKGVGFLCAGMLISYLDIHEARHVSCFWSYCGVGVRFKEDGTVVPMNRVNTTTRKYIDENGKEKECVSLGYNDKLHTWLLGVLPSSVFKTAKSGELYKVYLDYKNRYVNRADLKDAPPIKVHRMAIRQMVKHLLRVLWVAWRQYEGYELSATYEVEYLGRAPHEFNEAHCRAANIDVESYY